MNLVVTSINLAVAIILSHSILPVIEITSTVNTGSNFLENIVNFLRNVVSSLVINVFSQSTNPQFEKSNYCCNEL